MSESKACGHDPSWSGSCASVERALSSGRLLERQEIRAWLQRRRRETLNPKVGEELDDVILLLGSGEYAQDCEYPEEQGDG